MARLNNQEQCRAKRHFASHGAAGKFLHWLRKRNEEAKQLQPYKCEICGGWHLGHKPTDPVALHHADLLRREDIKAEEGGGEWEAEAALCKKR